MERRSAISHKKPYYSPPNTPFSSARCLTTPWLQQLLKLDISGKDRRVAAIEVTCNLTPPISLFLLDAGGHCHLECGSKRCVMKDLIYVCERNKTASASFFNYYYGLLRLYASSFLRTYVPVYLSCWVHSRSCAWVPAYRRTHVSACLRACGSACIHFCASACLEVWKSLNIYVSTLLCACVSACLWFWV